MVFEDGLQSRGLVRVSDIVQANKLAMEREEMDNGVFNVGTGSQVSILDVAQALGKHLAGPGPRIALTFRAGDICRRSAGIERIQKLGYQPRVSFEDGVEELVEWVRSQRAADGFAQARQELVSRGLAA